MWLTALSASAQENTARQIYNQAEGEYAIGRIEQALDILQNNIQDFTGNTQQSAYRLMALCWLGLDQEEKAETWTRSLLSQDPYYTASSQDPQRFIDMVERIKGGLTAKITTASSQEETIAEVPVPTTLITEEMIRNCGARNLQEVLATYVPGMHIIDSNDGINIAMRGVYSNGQEKILIMLNGHRLNSYSTNVASPDFSISLQKLKQIEVLRGPASSLYGGVALTAVVNLITKQGADVDGIEVKAGAGSYNQLRGDILFGKRYYDMDLLIWGSLYRNSGEDREREDWDTTDQDMFERYITIGRIGSFPSYDFGIQLKWKQLQFLFDKHSSQEVSPLTVSTFAYSYAHSKYRRFSNTFPSIKTSSNHADLSYSQQMGKLNLKGTVRFDYSDMTRYQVISDRPLEFFGESIGLPDELKDMFMAYGGLARYINAQEVAYGAHLKGDYAYINNDRHQGGITFGAEYSYFRVNDIRYQVVYDFTNTVPEAPSMLNIGKGHENSYNAFVQLKHKWNNFVFNAGMRYDHNIRYDNTKLDEFSPRLALIYIRPKWNLKFSYSKSFVDAPYFYRKSNDMLDFTPTQISSDVDLSEEFDNTSNDIDTPITIPSLSGTSSTSSEVLNSETVHSWQITFAGTEWIKGLNFEINGFYNKASNLIVTHILDYQNGGKNTTLGIEFMASYRRPKFTADFNFTWSNTIKASLFADYAYGVLINNSVFNDNNNTPAVMSNAVLTWKPWKPLKLFTNICFEGKQRTYNVDITHISKAMYYFHRAGNFRDDFAMYFQMLMNGIEELQNMIYIGEMNERIVFNVGAEYQWKRLTLGLNVHNLFNTHYFQSGMNTKLVPQKGRWIMGTIAYKF